MDSYPMTAAQLAARVAELEQECERLRPLAKRYGTLRDWLVDQHLLKLEHCQIDKPETRGLWWVLYRPAVIGEFVGYGKSEEGAIDAALSAQGADGPKE